MILRSYLKQKKNNNKYKILQEKMLGMDMGMMIMWTEYCTFIFEEYQI